MPNRRPDRDGGGDADPARGPRGNGRRPVGVGEGLFGSDRSEALLMEAVLEATGRLGYRAVTVSDVLRRTGLSAADFDCHFAGVRECFAAAYEIAIDRLITRLLSVAGSAGDWRSGLKAAMVELADYACRNPDQATAVLVEVRVAGEPVRAKREEVLKRLSHAIDLARREKDSRHSPPPVTAGFILSAIEHAVGSALVEGKPQRFEAAIPGLCKLAATPYFGD